MYMVGQLIIMFLLFKNYRILPYSKLVVQNLIYHVIVILNSTIPHLSKHAAMILKNRIKAKLGFTKS